jgi:hypothetical protein
LNEEKEDFMALDKRRNLSKEGEEKLSPGRDIGSLKRNIMGSK